MKIKNLLISLSLVACPVALAQDQAPTFTAKESLANTLKHLDTDGDFLSISNQTDYIDDIAIYLDNTLKSAPVPPKFKSINFPELLKATGFDEITSIGSSSKKQNNSFIHKTFLETKNANSGILSLLGGATETCIAPAYAPADTSLLLETKLDLTQVEKLVMNVLNSTDKKAAQEFSDNINQSIPPLGMSFSNLLSNLDTKLSIVASIDTHQQNFKTPPTVKVTARLDNIAKFVWPLLSKNLEGLIDIETQGSQHTFEIPEKIETAIGAYTVSVMFDLEKNHIWITNDTTHLAACLSSDKKLADTQDFQSTIKGLNNNGNALAYISKSLCLDVVKSIKALQKLDPKLEQLTTPMTEIEKIITQGQGLVFQFSKHLDGVSITSRTPTRMRASAMTSMFGVPVLASIAVPVVMDKLKDAERTRNLAQIKGLYFSLINYEAEFGDMPKELADLVKNGLIRKEVLNRVSTMKTNQGDMPVVYIYKENAKMNSIIMHTPAPIGDKHVILQRDGAALVIPAEELKGMLIRQR